MPERTGSNGVNQARRIEAHSATVRLRRQAPEASARGPFIDLIPNTFVSITPFIASVMGVTVTFAARRRGA